MIISAYHLGKTFIAATLAGVVPAAFGASCIAPDAGGTANIPESCAYLAPFPMDIVNGLPPGSTIAINGPLLTNFSGVTHTPDATGGEDVTFDTEMISLSLTGSGVLTGFSRTLSIPMLGQMHNYPRTVSTSPQFFEMDMTYLQGQVIGDPDFDLLRITMGTGFGLPSPGQTTLTQAGAAWAVDSFFDINWRIDFVGKPGSTLAGMSGSTFGTNRFEAQASTVPIPAAAWLLAPGFGLLVAWTRRRKAAP